MSEEPTRRIRFGELEVDLSLGEAFKSGRPVHLQEQPFRILKILLERPGELVTREELRQEIWGGEVFVDFDRSLNTAVARLRETLGDSPNRPVYIETVPRKGYRFIAPLADRPNGADREESSAGVREAAPVSRRSLRLYQALLGILGVVALYLAVAHFRGTPPEGTSLPLRKFTVKPPVAVGPFEAAISPNGRHVAFTTSEAPGAEGKLWIHHFGEQRSLALDGTEGADGIFWSPGSEFIGFAAGGALKKVPVTGGPTVQICSLPCARFEGAAWSPGGDLIALACNEVIYEVPARGGAADPRILPEEAGGPEPPAEENQPPSLVYAGLGSFLPAEAGPRVLLYFYRNTIIVRDLESDRREVLGFGVLPYYSPSGHIVYNSDSFTAEVWALPFSLDTLKATGEAFLIAQKASRPTVAADGTLAYLDIGGITRERLVWLDRRGAEAGEIGQVEGSITGPGTALSPDGQHVAGAAWEGSSHALWTWSLDRGVRMPWSPHGTRDAIPIWSADGGEIAFSSYRADNWDIFLRRANGSGEPTPLVATPNNEWAADWSSDGRHLLYVVDDPVTRNDLWRLERTGDGNGWQPHPFLQTPFQETVPKLSPDTRYIVYTSDESGRPEVYVESFPGGGDRAILSNSGGLQPRWSRDGKELFYTERSTLMAVSVSGGPGLTLGRPQRLFDHRTFSGFPVPQYDVSTDGRRFLVSELVGEASIRVVQNWFAEFKDRPRE